MLPLSTPKTPLSRHARLAHPPHPPHPPLRSTRPASPRLFFTEPAAPASIHPPAAPDPPALDLRRRSARDRADTIIERARWCLPDDRALLNAIYADGLSVADAARLRNTTPRTLRRRVRLTTERILSRRFEFVLRSRDDWPPVRRRIATACILQGRTHREAALHLRISIYNVRKHMQVITALFEDQLA